MALPHAQPLDIIDVRPLDAGLQAALAKAMALRDSGVRKFKLATTKAQRELAGASSVRA